MSHIDLENKTDALHMDDVAPALAATTTGPDVDKRQPVLDSAFAHLGFFPSARLFWRIVLIATGVFMGAMFDGFSVTIPGSISANSSFVQRFGTVIAADGTKALNAQYVGAWGGIQSGGQIIGMVTGGFTSDMFGRKFNMLVLSLLLAIAIVLELTAQNWIYFLMGRLLAGWATGLVQSGLTSYVAEISPTALRTGLLTIYSVWFGVGQFAAAIALQIVETHNLNWRSAFYSEIVFLGLFLPVAIFAPESPWYYANKGDHEGAKRALMRLNGRVAGYDVEHEYAVLESSVSHALALKQSASATSWLTVFKGVNGRRTWISFLPLATQQFLGIPLVFGNLAYFFSIAGIADPFLPSVASNAILIGGLIVAAFTVDKFGRRFLLLTGESINLICVLFMGVIGTLARQNGGELSSTSSNAIVALACIWVAAYSMSAGPLGWAYVADTATPVLRAKTTSFAAALTCCFGLIFNYTTPIMLSPQQANWGIEIGYFFAGLSALGLVLIYFTVPETRRLSFAELDELFEAKVSARKFKSTHAQLRRAEQAAGYV
ncbi:hypothetical protein JCM24511_09840 [Saitozyma sp. JCM 24511]|nr:hypothetical protein JCM24511_09840 [Saitozyma sp. JCM 24511]